MFLAAPMRIALAVTALALAGGVQAQVYKCKVDGKTIFSDQPCAASWGYRGHGMPGGLIVARICCR